jgi:hypothetical protein
LPNFRQLKRAKLAYIFIYARLPYRGRKMTEAFFLEVVVLLIFFFLLDQFLSDFPIKKRRLLVFLFPLATFLAGFLLRLSQQTKLIDLGYLLTEFSHLIISILFAVCLYLGQLKYWRVD